MVLSQWESRYIEFEFELELYYTRPSFFKVFFSKIFFKDFFQSFFSKFFSKNFRNAFLVLKEFKKDQFTISLISLLITNQDGVELKPQLQHEVKLEVHLELDLESNSMLHISLSQYTNAILL